MSASERERTRFLREAEAGRRVGHTNVVRTLAAGADIRTDVPRYRVFVRGEPVDEPTDITRYWRDDLVAFLFGCSGTFEGAKAISGETMLETILKERDT